MTPREYVTNQPVGSIIQLWAMKKSVKEKTDSSLLSSLFALSESGILSVHWLVDDDNQEVDYEISVDTENIYEYLLGKSKIIDSEFGLERDAKKIYPYFKRIATKQELIDAQRQGLSDAERDLLIQAKKIIEEMDLGFRSGSSQLKKVIESIATNGVRTGFDGADMCLI